eukprot:TRINITY_DN26560_c0_g4_i1.p1 TRINITY_DN26560_c0_g4~~TRINITY_DN26560_c0_g4_i1.p1  ORF type:complete len:449 (+),score=128.39 TRINITY_DN26560_c0_g4_i1:81-1349(+)
MPAEPGRRPQGSFATVATALLIGAAFLGVVAALAPERRVSPPAAAPGGGGVQPGPSGAPDTVAAVLSVAAAAAAAAAAAGAANDTCASLRGDAAQRRAAWERRNKRPFPGRRWGEEPDCGDVDRGAGDAGPAVHYQPRSHWAAQLINTHLRRAGGRWQTLRGLEIGPCSMKLSVPFGVQMEYADLSKEAQRQNCKHQRAGIPPMDYETDASSLAGVPTGRFDLVAAFHVLEHMHDVISAISAWLRVLRPGGLLLFAVPDACSGVERARLVTRAVHFAEDYRTKAGTPQESLRLHNAEAALSHVVGQLYLRKMVAEGAWADRAAATVGFPVCHNATALDAWAHFFDLPWRAALAWALADFVRFPNNGHLHVWSVESMRTMLGLAQRLLENIVPFDVVEAHVSARGFLQMRELHVALRRRQAPP